MRVHIQLSTNKRKGENIGKLSKEYDAPLNTMRYAAMVDGTVIADVTFILHATALTIVVVN